jgi:hypothetical protein
VIQAHVKSHSPVVFVYKSLRNTGFLMMEETPNAWNTLSLAAKEGRCAEALSGILAR